MNILTLNTFTQNREICKVFFVVLFCFTLLVPYSLQAQSAAKSGKIKSVTEFSVEPKNGQETKKSFQSFDERGNIIDETEYDDDGKVKDHTTYEYNSQSMKIKETHFLPDGKIESVTAYTYDESGNRTSKTVTGKDGSVKSKKVFRYEYR